MEEIDPEESIVLEKVICVFRKKIVEGGAGIRAQEKTAFNKLPLVAMVPTCPVNNNYE